MGNWVSQNPLGTYLSFTCSNSQTMLRKLSPSALSGLCLGPWEAVWLELPLSPTMLHFCIQNTNPKRDFDNYAHRDNCGFQEISPSSGTSQHFISSYGLASKAVYTAYLSHPDHFQLVWNLHRKKTCQFIFILSDKKPQRILKVFITLLLLQSQKLRHRNPEWISLTFLF